MGAWLQMGHPPGGWWCEDAMRDGMRGPPVAGAGDRGWERNGAVSASVMRLRLFLFSSDFIVKSNGERGENAPRFPPPVKSKLATWMACVFSLDQALAPIGPPAWHRRERQVLARHHPFLLRQWQRELLFSSSSTSSHHLCYQFGREISSILCPLEESDLVLGHHHALIQLGIHRETTSPDPTLMVMTVETRTSPES